MKKRFRVVIDFEATVHERKKNYKRLNVRENKDVNRLALHIATDEKELMDWMEFNITELLGDDFYTGILYEKLKIRCEDEIIRSAIEGMGPEASASLIGLFSREEKTAGTTENTGEQAGMNKKELKASAQKKDSAMNLLYSYFENPRIVDATFEPITRGRKSSRKNQ